MNQWLAQMYGTNGAQEEETSKLANAELFAKLAAKNNIDLSSMSPEAIGELYAEVFPEEASKVASESSESSEEDEDEEKGEEKDDEEKSAAAAQYWQEKRASQEKFAEADLMGRVMAHSFVQELESIKEAAGAKELAGKALGVAKGVGERGAELLSGSKLKSLKGTAEAAASRAAKHKGGGYASPSASKALKQLYGEKAHKAGKAATSEAKKVWGTRAGVAGGVGGAGALAASGKGEKTAGAEAFEEMAAVYAIEMAKEGGYDADEAFTRVNAVYTLGLEESEKIAAVQSADDALHVRALEYLEQAAYPVNWEEVLG